MTFLSMLLALLIDRVLWDGTRFRQHRWFRDYLARLRGMPWLGAALDSAWGAAAVLALPVLLVGWLQWSVMPHFGPLIAFAFGLLVLLFGLGPQELGRSMEAYLAHLDRGDQDQARAIARDLEPLIEQAPYPGVALGILGAACRRLIGPLAWFVVFGATGVALYRLTQQLYAELAAGDRQGPLLASAGILVRALDWIPIRLTAVGYAIAGNFNAAVAAWQQHVEAAPERPDDQALLQAVGAAALGQREYSDEISLIEDSLALVSRMLVVWVLLIGAISLFRL